LVKAVLILLIDLRHAETFPEIILSKWSMMYYSILTNLRPPPFTK
jgi:hypothetical protein